MKVFVTGAAGFVGSRLAKAVLDRGDSVVGHDNFDPYYAREHKDRHLRDLLPEKNFSFIEGDLRNADLLGALLRQGFGGLDPDEMVAEVKERLAAIGYTPVANTPEEFSAQIKRDVARWAKVIKDAGIKQIE